MATDCSTRKRPKNRYDRARKLGQLGYALAENRYCPGLYEIRKSDGTIYRVDLERETCTCPATVVDCAHLVFVHRCLAFAASLDRRPVVTTPRRQPRMGARRHRALSLLPAAPTPAPSPDLRRAVEAALCALEAAEAAKYQPSFSLCMRLEDEYVDALDTAARIGGYRLHDVRTAVEWRKGGCSDVLAVVAEVVALRAAAERRAA